MSSCSTVPASTSVGTSYSTSTVTGQQVSTLPGSTSTVSSAVLVTSCAPAPTVSGDGGANAQPSCTTSTSYSVYPTVLPGSTTTVYSTGETLVPVYSTAIVPASTVCTPIQTSAPSPTPSRTTSDTPDTQPTSASSPTSQVVVVVGASSSTKILTTTSTFIPTPSSADPSAASDPAVSPAAGAVTSTARSQQMVLSTSYLTLVFTTTDNSGHASTYASAVPTLLNVPKNNAAATNKGAIAGGVVGGVLALILAVLAFLLMKKRGLFRKGDDEIEEDAWAPPAHGEYYGTASGRNRTATGGTLVGGGGGFDDEKLGENDREVDAATLERHQSWYVAGGAGGRAMEEIYHESAQFAAARSSSPQGYAGAAETIGAAAMGYQGVTRSRSDGGLGGGQPTRSHSNRLSVYSVNGGGSSQGHSQEHASPTYPQHLPAIPDHRLSGFSYYPNYPLAQPENYRPASPPQQRPRSASPTSPNHYDPSSHVRSNTLPHRLAATGLALPSHLRTDSHGSRPTLEAIQGGSRNPSASNSNSSSSSPSRGDTSESLPTTSTHALQHSNSYGSATTNSPYSIPQLDRLKVQRPGFERAASTESFVAPVQWLGAKIANADSASESGLESKEDLTEKLHDL
ncbi:hypothetical protein JCM5350_002042 [Sporobolomyces pararoseus]